jgi:hypothetical protein
MNRVHYRTEVQEYARAKSDVSLEERAKRHRVNIYILVRGFVWEALAKTMHVLA